MRDVIHFMLALRGFGGPAECPWAWWWRAWRGWRTSWCLQTDQQGKPHLLLEEPSQRSSGNADRSWNLERFLAQDAGRAACGSTARWISGNDGSHEERLYQACNDEVSWLHRWQERSYELPLWRAVFVELFRFDNNEVNRINGAITKQSIYTWRAAFWLAKNQEMWLAQCYNFKVFHGFVVQFRSEICQKIFFGIIERF